MSKIEELRARLKADPGSRHFYYLGEELRKAGQHQEAIDVLRQGLAGQPAYASAWIGLGRTLKDLGQHQEAIESLKKGLELDPSNAVPARLLAESYLAIGDKIEAIKKFKFFNAVMPGDDAVEEVIDRLERELAIPDTGTPQSEAAEDGSTAGAAAHHEDLIGETSGSEVAPIGPDASFAGNAAVSAERMVQNESDLATTSSEPLFEEIDQPFDAISKEERGESDGDLLMNPRKGERPFDHAVDGQQDERIPADSSAEHLFDEDEMRSEPASLHEWGDLQSEPPLNHASSEEFDDQDSASAPFDGGEVDEGIRSEPIRFESDGPFATDDGEIPGPGEPFPEDQEPPLAEVIPWRASSDPVEPEAIEESVLESEQRFEANRPSDEVASAPTPFDDRHASAVDDGSGKTQVVSRLENWLSAIRRERDV